MLKDPEKTLTELIALGREQWETLRHLVEIAREQKAPRLARELANLTVPQLGDRGPNGAKPLCRARTTKHFPTLSTDKRRDKMQELLSKEWFSKPKLVRAVRKAFNLTNYPKYKDGTDVLTSLVYGDLSYMKKSNALENTTGPDGTPEYRFIPGSTVDWTKE